MKVINLLAGPGCGKSTTAAGLFSKMKIMGFHVQLVTEYIKDAVFEGRKHIFDDQIYIFAKQHRRQFILQEQCDWIVTDSPILLSAVYAPENYFPSFEKLVMEAHNHYDNYNFFLDRKKKYVNLGRIQTKKEAIEIDKRVLKFMKDHNIEYQRVIGDEWAPLDILHHLNRYHGWKLNEEIPSHNTVDDN